jgi:hypothetical protein
LQTGCSRPFLRRENRVANIQTKFSKVPAKFDVPDIHCPSQAMSFESTENLDQLIEREKRLVAEEYFQEMWDAAIADGIDMEIIARTIILGTLTELSRRGSDEAAIGLLGEMDDLVVSGDFLPAKTIQ